MKRPKFPIWIYAIKDSAGVVIYVGQSWHPLNRLRQIAHKHALSGCQLLIVRPCRERQAGKLEGQVIRAYKRRGACRLNKVVYPFRVERDSRPGKPVTYEGKTYPSLSALARSRNCCVLTLRNHGIIPK